MSCRRLQSWHLSCLSLPRGREAITRTVQAGFYSVVRQLSAVRGAERAVVASTANDREQEGFAPDLRPSKSAIGPKRASREDGLEAIPDRRHARTPFFPRGVRVCRMGRGPRQGGIRAHQDAWIPAARRRCAILWSHTPMPFAGTGLQHRCLNRRASYPPAPAGVGQRRCTPGSTQSISNRRLAAVMAVLPAGS